MKRRYRAVLGALVGALVLIVSGCVSQVASLSAQTESAGATNVYTTARVGNVLIIGGNFTRVYSPDFKGIRGAGGLAAINATTGQWIWSASPGGTVYRLATDGNTFWAGGTFGIKHFSATGAPIAFKDPYGLGTIKAIAAGGGRVYYADTASVAAVSTSGTGAWTVPVNGEVSTLAFARNGTRLLVGGFFCNIKGVYRPALASLGTPTGAFDTTFNAANFGCGSHLVARAPLDLLVSGNVAYVAAGGSLNRLAAVNALTGATIWATPRGDGDVQTVVLKDGSLYIGGHFSCVDGGGSSPCRVARQKAAKYSTAGVLDPFWKPDFRGGFPGIWSMVGDATALYVGGNFTSVNGVTHQKVAIFRS